MNEALLVIIGLMAGLYCAETGQLGDTAKAKVESHAEEVINAAPSDLIALALAHYLRMGPVPEELCKTIDDKFGGQAL